MTELWKPIPGYERLGFVSNLGRVKSAMGEIRLQQKSYHGYMRVGLAGGAHTLSVHRLVALAFVENTKQAPQVNHKDGNKANNAADNLEWVTAKENVAHSIEHGLRTASHRKAIVPNSDFEAIRSRLADGETYQSIGKSYGVSASAIHHRLHRIKPAIEVRSN